LGRSRAGQDGKYLRKPPSKNHTISSKLFYLFQLNFKKKKIPLPLKKNPVSTLIEESIGNRRAQLLRKKVEEKIKIEKDYLLVHKKKL
jgi:hypothetical protein